MTDGLLTDRIARLKEQIKQERDDRTLAHREIAGAESLGDPRLEAASLATALDLDALEAMRGETELAQLIEQRDARRRIAAGSTVDQQLNEPTRGDATSFALDVESVAFGSGGFYAPAQPRDARLIQAGVTTDPESLILSRAWPWALLHLEVMTGYELTGNSQAEVIVNNNEIGKIEPRPQARYRDLQVVTIGFETKVIDPAPYTGSTELRIITSPLLDGWVILRNWWVHYMTSLA